MKCDAYHILIHKMLKGELNLEEATVVARHMDVCDECRTFHRELVGRKREEMENDGARSASSGGGSIAGHTSLAAAVVLGVILFVGVLYALRHEGWLNGFAHRGHGPAQHHCSTP